MSLSNFSPSAHNPNATKLQWLCYKKLQLPATDIITLSMNCPQVDSAWALGSRKQPPQQTAARRPQPRREPRKPQQPQNPKKEEKKTEPTTTRSQPPEAQTKPLNHATLQAAEPQIARMNPSHPKWRVAAEMQRKQNNTPNNKPSHVTCSRATTKGTVVCANCDICELPPSRQHTKVSRSRSSSNSSSKPCSHIKETNGPRKPKKTQPTPGKPGGKSHQTNSTSQPHRNFNRR